MNIAKAAGLLSELSVKPADTSMDQAVAIVGNAAPR
jgi:hypothetical protein